MLREEEGFDLKVEKPLCLKLRRTEGNELGVKSFNERLVRMVGPTKADSTELIQERESERMKNRSLPFKVMTRALEFHNRS
mmetsp:Transcript_7961/g.15980  ORF Transcript_7961/g.15980 Transcript_7961/m.15980 type:complete len:81 (-) Transcript_7961:275-517(-)